MRASSVIVRVLPALFAALFAFAAHAAEAEREVAPSPGVIDRVVERGAITDADCAQCHGVAGYAVPTGAHGDTAKRPLFVGTDDLRDSVHGKLACLSCHEDIERLPHGKGPFRTVDCVGCHRTLHREAPALVEQVNASRAMVGMIPDFTPSATAVNRQAGRYDESIHGRSRKDDPGRRNAECRDCHGTHYVYPATSSKAMSHRLQSPEVCGRCHEKQLGLYRTSVHGAALMTPWKGDSATCSDCHSAHDISEAKGLTARRAITESCGDCHAQALRSYLDTYHGQLAWLGGKDVARCHDCHQPHDTPKVDAPASKVNSANRLETCRTCHKEADAGLAAFLPHGNTHDFAKYPHMWLVAKGMVVLVVAVLVFFYAHSMLWFRRERLERRAAAAAGRAVVRPLHRDERHVRRFSWPWRLNHWLLALSVMTLVFTGMTAKYADSAWAVPLVELLGNRPEAFAVVHRVAAVGFLAAVFGHTAGVLFNILVRQRGRFQWFGPDSLLPRWKDWHDMVGQFRWFLGKGEPPRFDRWTYWEKFDYWAVYWGALVIGLSGLILWFPAVVARFLPGWVFNVATLAHGVEAFLAVTTLFVVHFFNNHFRPQKFPLDTVMFVGGWPIEEFREERPEEYRRLVEGGGLAARLTPAPTRAARIVAHILGFSLIGIGLMLLVLVAIGFARSGLL